MGKNQLKEFEGHQKVHCVAAVTMVMGLFSERQKLETRTDTWDQDVMVYTKTFTLTCSYEASRVPSKAILLPALSWQNQWLVGQGSSSLANVPRMVPAPLPPIWKGQQSACQCV